MLDKEYNAIKRHYGDRRAARTNLPYMKHIDEGLTLLRTLTEDEVVYKAWCIHPIIQIDESFRIAVDNGLNLITNSNRALLYAMEYRGIANNFLPYHVGMRYPHSSPLPEVNLMLIVDKIQNWRDARIHLTPVESTAVMLNLEQYFADWRATLDITEELRIKYEAVIEGADHG